jgi:hypothetical protein
MSIGATHFGAWTPRAYPGEDQEKLAICYAQTRWIQKQVATVQAPPKQKPNKFSDLVSAIDALHDAIGAKTIVVSDDELLLPEYGSNLTKKAFAAGFSDQGEYERAVALGYKSRAEYAPALFGAQLAARKKAREAINNGTASY